MKGKYEDATFFEKVNGIRRGGLNVLISMAISGTVLIYSIASLSTGTLDCTKWPEIENQREIQAEQEARVDSDRRFYEAEKNKDSVIDSNEFYDYILRQRE